MDVYIQSIEFSFPTVQTKEKNEGVLNIKTDFEDTTHVH